MENSNVNKRFPTIGRIVNYYAYRDFLFDNKKTFFAALITDVPNSKESIVSLAVFSDNGIFFRQNIPQGREEGRWDWPIIC